MKKILASLLIAGSLTALVLVTRAPAASTAPTASAAAPELPDVLVNGFKEFKSGGYSAATTAWAKDSSLLQDTQTLQALNNYFTQIGNTAGSFQGADVVRVVNLSVNTQIIYTAARYEREVVYLSFTCYKSGDKWLITVINADKDPAKILPTNILSGQ